MLLALAAASDPSLVTPAALLVLNPCLVLFAYLHGKLSGSPESETEQLSDVQSDRATVGDVPAPDDELDVVQAVEVPQEEALESPKEETTEEAPEAKDEAPPSAPAAAAPVAAAPAAAVAAVGPVEEVHRYELHVPLAAEAEGREDQAPGEPEAPGAEVRSATAWAQDAVSEEDFLSESELYEYSSESDEEMLAPGDACEIEADEVPSSTADGEPVEIHEVLEEVRRVTFAMLVEVREVEHRQDIEWHPDQDVESDDDDEDDENSSSDEDDSESEEGEEQQRAPEARMSFGQLLLQTDRGQRRAWAEMEDSEEEENDKDPWNP